MAPSASPSWLWLNFQTLQELVQAETDRSLESHLPHHMFLSVCEMWGSSSLVWVLTFISEKCAYFLFLFPVSLFSHDHPHLAIGPEPIFGSIIELI